MSILVTGGSGFIGSNFVLEWINKEDDLVINLDKLTYAGNNYNLSSVENNKKYLFRHGDIGDSNLVLSILKEFKPKYIVNFAAESHVDRSINNPDCFIKTNINGTFYLLNAVKEYWLSLSEIDKTSFRFLHISTDEVFGTLNLEDSPFTEESCYKPNNPYSASKASSDHLVRSFFKTYNLPVLTTNCSNNYGPYQFPEKLIPLVINNALEKKRIPIYGDGLQIRDWLYVKDHCSAIRKVLSKGVIGETYNIGGNNEKTNIELVKVICNLLDEFKPLDEKKDLNHYEELIEYVQDRPGHDRRYVINSNKIQKDLGWNPSETFESGIKKTVLWYLSNLDWVNNVKNANYLNWVKNHYKS